MLQKIVFRADICCDKGKKKIMKTVASVGGLESVKVDSKDQKFTLIGDADAVSIINKLRTFTRSKLVSVGPAKKPEKKQPEKKPEKKDKKKYVKKDEKKDDKKPAPKKPEKKDKKKYVKKDEKKDDKKPAPKK